MPDAMWLCIQMLKHPDKKGENHEASDFATGADDAVARCKCM